MKGFAVLIAAGLLAVPVVAPPYYVNVASQILIAAVFASSLNLLVGYAGLTSLGHAAYLGFAAYTVGWLTTRAGLGHLAAAVLALGLTTIMAAFFGLLALRGTGLTFLMITLALGQILWGIAYRWVSLTGGDNGLTGLTRPRPLGLDLTPPAAYYLFTLAVTAVTLAGIAMYVRSPLGAAVQGSRDQPRRLQALGHNVWMVRWLTFVLAGAAAGVAGLLFVYYNQFVAPGVLALTSSAEALLMVIAGGAGTLPGPVVGAAIVVALKTIVSTYLTRWVMLLGVVFVLIVVFMPEGIVPGLARVWRTRWRS
ncbi:MAG TPA: branched-chain amino acid ABC transporter permease [Candidatus Binatia bacterium]|nr:branched-chain amino acid ABC transporter permease [Candidatus Binatia bacterium]